VQKGLGNRDAKGEVSLRFRGIRLMRCGLGD
jgi:hypothetical protein